MVKTVGTAVAAIIFVYEVAKTVCSPLAATPAAAVAYQSECPAMQTFPQEKRNPQTVDSKSADMARICETYAATVGAMVLPGFEP